MTNMTAEPLEHDIAALGNGQDQDLTPEQLEKINALYDGTLELRDQLLEYLRQQQQQQQPPPDMATQDYSYLCDHETCRRYLVARSWDLPKARAQFESTLQWRMEPTTLSRPPYDFGRGVDITCQDPYALCMRLVGWDATGRPVLYTNFAQAYDRFDANNNARHMMALFDATVWWLAQQRKNQGNATAASRQWCIVVDFDGFGLYDQNPKSGMLVAQLLQHYPELMGTTILINAPTIFYGMYKLISPLLDASGRAKIAFVSMNLKNSEQAKSEFETRFGRDMAEWLTQEIMHSLQHKMDQQSASSWWSLSTTKEEKEKRAYWIPEEDGHDGRGLKKYVESEFYVETPGDLYVARQKQQQEEMKEVENGG